jgi:hypothetical protein
MAEGKWGASRLITYCRLYNLVPSLKSGARVGIVDAFKPTSEHGRGHATTLPWHGRPQRLQLSRICRVKPGLSDDTPSRFIRVGNPFLFSRILQCGLELLAVQACF